MKAFYAVVAAGAAFIAIGIAASVYSGVAVEVPLDGRLAPGLTDELSPDMNVGNTASLTVSGSTFDIEIKDPEGQQILLQTDQSNFSYELTASKAGEYRFVIKNTGDADVVIQGHAQTKGNPLGFTGPLMLVVTGIVVLGLGLRLRRR
mgnify:CR=1 FL=1